MSQLIGSTIGAYTIDSALPLGSGGVGQVFRAQPQAGGQLVALKLLHPQYATDKKVVERFRREAALLQQFRHPNIVEVYDSGDFNGQTFLVMELMPQGSLLGLMQRRASRSWPLSLGIDLMLQAAEGLAYAHSQGVVHRDIKPANLLLRQVAAPAANNQALLTSLITNAPMPANAERYVLKVADFGVAHLANRSQMTSTGGVIGTPAYMSPEQCRGRAVDMRSDIYTFGAVLYEIATGAPSVDVESATAAIYNILLTTPAPPRTLNPALPVAVEAIILRCLEKEPDRRYQTMGELADALRAALTLPEVTRAGLVPTPRPTMRLGSANILVTPDRLSLSLVPGQQASIEVAVRNLSNQVDHYDLLIEGVPVSWVTLQPQVLQIDPNKSANLQLQILVPRDPANRAADYTVTIRARSQSDPSEEGVAQMTWSVLPFAGGTLQLGPKLVRASREASYRLKIRNDGNAPAQYTLAVDDLRNALGFEFLRDQQALDPAQSLLVEPGAVVELRLKARAKRHWMGSPRTHSFTVGLMGGDQPQQSAAQFIQKALAPAWLATAAPVVLLLILAILFAPPIFWDATSSPLLPGDAEPVTVSWRTLNAGSYSLRPSLKDSQPITITATSPSSWLGMEPEHYDFAAGFPQTTTVELVAWNLFGLSSSSREIAIGVDIAKPVIDTFAVSTNEIIYGEPLTVTLRVRRAQQITIEPGGIDIPVATNGITTVYSLVLTPTATMSYRLIAAKDTAKPDEQTLAPVIVKPRIDAFAVEGAGQELIAGTVDTTAVSWKVAGAASITILANGEQIHADDRAAGTAELPAPKVTTEYTLLAKSADGAQNVLGLSVSARMPICTVKMASAGIHAAPLDDLSVIGYVVNGDQVRPLEILSDGRWTRIEPTSNIPGGWINNEALSCDIDLARIAIAEVVPTAVPTYTPVPTVTPTMTPTAPVIQPPPTFTPTPTNPNSGGSGEFTPGQIAFVSNRNGNPEIYLMNTDGSGLRQVTNNRRVNRTPSWSPAGDQIAFSSGVNTQSDIYVMSADGSNLVRLTDGKSDNLTPTWSPDGRKIAFSKLSVGAYQIFSMNSDGSNLVQLTNTSSTAHNLAPKWSPDGRMIVFYSTRDQGNAEIYIMNYDGSNEQRVTVSDAIDGSPSWSPDSNFIVFDSLRDQDSEVYIMSISGGNLRNITNRFGADHMPGWSRDGRQIIFWSNRDGNEEIYMMMVDGSNQKNLTVNSANDSEPAWRP